MNNNIIVIGGGGASNANTLIYSFNGLNWIGLGHSTIDNVCYNVMYANNQFFAGGGSSGTGNNTLAQSYDGINWNGLGKTIFTTNGGYYILYDGGKYIAGGSGTNTLAYSYDGKNFIGLGTNIFNNVCSKITYNKKIYLACGSNASGNNTLAYSYDGINWNGLGKTIFTTSANYSIWNGKMFVIVGSGNNTLAYSYNGIDIFPSKTSLFANAGQCATWFKNMFIASGNGNQHNIVYSKDGINWFSYDGFVTSSMLVYGLTNINNNSALLMGWRVDATHGGLAISYDGFNFYNVENTLLLPNFYRGNIKNIIIIKIIIKTFLICIIQNVYQQNVTIESENN